MSHTGDKGLEHVSRIRPSGPSIRITAIGDRPTWCTLQRAAARSDRYALRFCPSVDETADHAPANQAEIIVFDPQNGAADSKLCQNQPYPTKIRPLAQNENSQIADGAWLSTIRKLKAACPKAHLILYAKPNPNSDSYVLASLVAGCCG
jgi:hypothetical protein